MRTTIATAEQAREVIKRVIIPGHGADLNACRVLELFGYATGLSEAALVEGLVAFGVAHPQHPEVHCSRGGGE